MRNTKNQRRTLVVLAAVALAGIAAQSQDPIGDPTYPDTKKDEQTSSERRNYDRRQEADSTVADRADHRSTKSMHGKNVSANKLIGKEVRNDQDERLGTVNDLILSDDFSVKYAVLSTGGAFGVGATKIAVPINDLKCGGDSIRLSATKEDLKNLGKTPTGEWSSVSGEEWTHNIDGYYGQPMALSNHRSDDRFAGTRTHRDWRYEREAVKNINEYREPVRTKQGDGARELINHPSNFELFDDSRVGDSNLNNGNSSDRMLQQSVNDTLRQDYDLATAQAVTVSVENSEVTLRGTVGSNAEKQNIESRVKAMSGVSRVNNQLEIRD